jgi:hypothetical protein
MSIVVRHLKTATGERRLLSQTSLVLDCRLINYLDEEVERMVSVNGQAFEGGT